MLAPSLLLHCVADVSFGVLGPTQLSQWPCLGPCSPPLTPKVLLKLLKCRCKNDKCVIQALHQKGAATADHTTLLLNCYTKLRNVQELDEFIKNVLVTPRMALCRCVMQECHCWLRCLAWVFEML